CLCRLCVMQWQLCVWKASWRPAYLVPLLVVLVLVALALSAATFTVLLSRHEHRALLHSLLPKEAIQKLQAEFHWENHDGARQGMVGSGGCEWLCAAKHWPVHIHRPLCCFRQASQPAVKVEVTNVRTPAEMILSFTQDILLGRLPDLPKVMAVRHTLQQSLDVYQPLQADLTQRMAETENMDGEVRDALMLQLVGRRAEAEAEEEWDQMSVPAESGCYASEHRHTAAPSHHIATAGPAASSLCCCCACLVAGADVNVHTLLTVSEEESLPATLAPASPPATKQAGVTASFTSSAAATAREPLRPIGCRRTAAGSPTQREVQAAGSHNLPVVKDPVDPVEGQEVQAADSHVLPVCSRDQTSPCLQPSPVLTNKGTEAAVESAAAAAAAASVSLHRLPSITKRPSMTADDGHGIDPRSRHPTVLSILEHIMSQLQPEAPPPGSGTALLLLQPTPLLAGTGAGLAHLSQPAGHEPDGAHLGSPHYGRGVATAAVLLPLFEQMACGEGTAGGSGDEESKCRSGSIPLHPQPELGGGACSPCLGSALSRAQMPLVGGSISRGPQGRRALFTPILLHTSLILDTFQIPSKFPLTQVETCLSSANSWAFDAFQLTSATAGRPLSVLAYWLLHQSGLAAWAHLDHTKLARWLCRIEDGYCANPYHNRSHAADVVQTMHMLLTRGGLMPGYADHLTQLAAYLAAVCHDYQHIGRTNDWLVETQDELALRYNDRSPMENHHLAGAFSLLKHPDMNFLQAMPKATYDRLRKLVIELVLGTDMKQHFSIIGQFTALHRTGGDGQATGRKVSQPGQATELHMGSTAQPIAKDLPGWLLVPTLWCYPNKPCYLDLAEPSRADKMAIELPMPAALQMALKCSDLGHLAAPLPVHLAWVSRLEAEFFAQGDAERAQGLTISPLCDRTKQGITKSQVGFFEFVALPLFTNFTARFTAAKPLLRGVMANYHHWQAQATVAAEPQAPAQGG
ncbi:hypothetical protein QJQ45_022997, partial [Haematococcus lacustris]